MAIIANSLEAMSPHATDRAAGRAHRFLAWAVSDWAVWVVVALGTIVRLRLYLANRSLWLDESMVGINILDRSLLGLTGALEYAQRAPIGWLWASRVATQAFGSSEPALRLVPLLAGLAALVAFVFLARRFLPRPAAVLAVALFAFSPGLVYYASEAKQYSSDALVTVLILWAMPIPGAALESRRRVALFGAAGALAIFCSHPAVFVLAGAGGAWMVGHALRRRRDRVFATAGVAVAWLVVFAITYALQSDAGGIDAGLRRHWEAGFARLPFSVSGLAWYGGRAVNVFHNLPMDLDHEWWLGAVLFALGVGWFVRRHPLLGLAVAGPLGVTLCVSGFRMYPFASRLLLFSAPLFILLVSAGARGVWEWLSGRWRWIAVALALWVLYPGAQMSVRMLARGHSEEELRTVLEKMQGCVRPTDEIWVYQWAMPTWRYYTQYHPNPFAFPSLASCQGATKHSSAGCSPSPRRRRRSAYGSSSRIWTRTILISSTTRYRNLGRSRHASRRPTRGPFWLSDSRGARVLRGSMECGAETRPMQDDPGAVPWATRRSRQPIHRHATRLCL